MFLGLSMVAGVIVAAVVVLLLIAARKPDTFRVARAIAIQAPAETIFAHIADFNAWPGWSPYEGRDPAMQRTLSGASSSVGAVYEWKGNNKVGHGRMEILQSQASSNIVIQLDFYAPFEAHNTAEFRLEAQGADTRVTWAMHGPAPFKHKVMSTLMNMDKLVGVDFEKGLSNLKGLAEK